MIVEEEFSADEENKKVMMGKSWKLAAYRDATDFVVTYQQIMPALEADGFMTSKGHLGLPGNFAGA
jgi:hypothetical protein